MGRTSEYEPGDSYELRQSVERSFKGIVVLLIGSGLFGAGAYLFWSSSHNGSSIGSVVAAAVLALVAVYFLVMAMDVLVRGLRRSILIKVDERGITFGPNGPFERTWFAPWETIVRLETNTICTREYSETAGWHLNCRSYIQVDLKDGKNYVRTAPVSRDDPSFPIDDINDAVRAIAPQVPIEDTWEKPEARRPGPHLPGKGNDPFLPGY